MHLLTLIRLGGQPTDGSDPNLLTPGSQWSQSIYMCASTARARIATVTFSVNGTDSLSGLNIDIDYSLSDQPTKELPIWGVEKTKLLVSEVEPIWGLVDRLYLDFQGLQTIESNYLYLPASSSMFGDPSFVVPTFDTLASAFVPGLVLNQLYSDPAAVTITGVPIQTLDYSGTTYPPIRAKWRQIGRSTENIASMLDLIYIDQMAQLVVGSKSLLDISAEGVWEAEMLASRISYDIRYAIPVILHSNSYILMY